MSIAVTTGASAVGVGCDAGVSASASGAHAPIPREASAGVTCAEPGFSASVNYRMWDDGSTRRITRSETVDADGDGHPEVGGEPALTSMDCSEDSRQYSITLRTLCTVTD